MAPTVVALCRRGRVLRAAAPAHAATAPARGAWGDPFDAISSLHHATRRWFPAAYEPGASALPSAPAFQHGFAGLVMLADWLGSDTTFFAYSAAGDVGLDQRADRTAKAIMLRLQARVLLDDGEPAERDGPRGSQYHRPARGHRRHAGGA